MSQIQDAEPTLDGFIPQAEPPQETPQPEGSPDEQKKEVETPGEPDSATTPAVETTPTKTPEQLEEDRAFFQKKFQEERERSKAAIEQLRELQGKVTPQVNLTEFSKPQTPSTTPQPAQTFQIPGIDPNQMTREEINNYLLANPDVQLQVLQYQLAQTLDQKLTEREQARAAENQLQVEQDKSYAVLNQYVTANGVTPQEVQDAANHLKSLGVNARPAAVTELLIKQIEFNKWQAFAAQQAQEATAKAVQAVKKQALTIAPTGGGGAEPKPKSTSDNIAARFKPTNAAQVIEQLFGSK